jgi:hypothetical protein
MFAGREEGDRKRDRDIDNERERERDKVTLACYVVLL